MLIFLFFLFSTLNSSQIYINEIVSDNDNIILDFQNDSPDWIELYNPNDFDVNLYDYSLSDDKYNPIVWTFPNIEIKAKSFLVIFCSGKDTIVGNEVHTNFSISSEGEELFLYDNNPDIVKRKKLDFIEIPALRENKAYGKLPDGDGKLSYLSTYSPGETNIYSDEITCSYESGFYKDSIIVELKSTMGYEIRYTLDGSDPDENSPIYTKPITLYNSSDKPNKYCEIITTPAKGLIGYKEFQSPKYNLDKMHILKYVSNKNQKTRDVVYFKNFYVDKNEFETNMPIISLNADSLDLFSYERGIYVPGEKYDSLNPAWSGNYFHYGRNFETKSNFILFNNSKKFMYNQNITIQIHGGGTRTAAQKSIRIIGRNMNCGDEIEINLLDKEISVFKKLNLKTTMGVWTWSNLVQNELTSLIAEGLNVERLGFQPVIVFLNGEYWGIHNLTEHNNKDYFANYHKEPKDSIDIIYHGHMPAVFGSEIDFKELISFIKNNSLDIDSNYDHVKEEIDINSFIDYFLIEIFVGNYDWPNGNIKAWRPRGANYKWRWLLFDVDFAFNFNNPTYNMFTHLSQDQHSSWPNPKESTFLFRSLFKSNEFKEQFDERFRYLINNNFEFNFTSKLYLELVKHYILEMHRHYERWEYPENFDENWQHYSDSLMLDFLLKRPDIIKEHYDNFKNLLSYDLDECYGNQCDDNGITIYPNPSIGKINIKSIDKYRNSNITVYNHVGKVVYNLDDLFVEEGKQLDLSLLVNGVYFIRFKNQFGQYTFERIVINR